MLSNVLKQPISVSLCLVWITVWIMVATNEKALPALCGKGFHYIGHQYYRFFTAGLTHTHVLHLLANVCAMLWIGYLYEQRMGSLRFLTVAIFCALLSQVLFLAIYSKVTESFGGSGYNYALCGFALTMQFLLPNFPKMTFGTWSGNWLILYLILGNIPMMSFMNITTFIFHIIAFLFGVGAAFVYWILGKSFLAI